MARSPALRSYARIVPARVHLPATELERRVGGEAHKSLHGAVRTSQKDLLRLTWIIAPRHIYLIASRAGGVGWGGEERLWGGEGADDYSLGTDIHAGDHLFK